MRIIITASGPAYQEAAAWAAATFALQAGTEHNVLVLIPSSEPVRRILNAHARKFGFSIGRFPFRQISESKYTSQLKCQAYAAALSELKRGEIALFADADTCCVRPLSFPVAVVSSVHTGGIGLAPDIADRHFISRSDPWYLAPEERLPYVNSGVILASTKSIERFRRFRALSEQPKFLCGPFNDQKIINYAMGKYFRDGLVQLDQKYNSIGPPFAASAVIAHHAGGAGWLAQQRRKAIHQAHCAEILEKKGAAARLLNLRAAARSSQPPRPLQAKFPTVCAKHTRERLSLHTDELPKSFKKNEKLSPGPVKTMQIAEAKDLTSPRINPFRNVKLKNPTAEACS